MLAISLKFRRFVTEGALNALAQLEFHPRGGALKVRESFSPEIFQFREKSLQLLNALSEVVDRQ
jgi:hypothetical protein